jgi:hypothetical protein
MALPGYIAAKLVVAEAAMACACCCLPAAAGCSRSRCAAYSGSSSEGCVHQKGRERGQKHWVRAATLMEPERPCTAGMLCSVADVS